MKKQKTQKNLNKYEALVILDTAGREDAEKDIIERVQKEIQQAGGKVETVQKMGPKPFARVTHKRSAGSYVNFIFAAPGKAIAELDAKFHLDTDLFRWQFTDNASNSSGSGSKAITLPLSPTRSDNSSV